MILIAIILFIGTLIIDLVTDYRLLLNNRSIDHDRGTWLRAIGLIPAIILLTIATKFIFPYWIISIAISGGVICFNYWNLFDGFLNLLRSEKWFWTGSDDEDDAKSDNFVQGLKRWEHVAIKIGLSLAFIVVYIIIL